MARSRAHGIFRSTEGTRAVENRDLTNAPGKDVVSMSVSRETPGRWGDGTHTRRGNFKDRLCDVLGKDQGGTKKSKRNLK